MSAGEDKQTANWKKARREAKLFTPAERAERARREALAKAKADEEARKLAEMLKPVAAPPRVAPRIPTPAVPGQVPTIQSVEPVANSLAAHEARAREPETKRDRFELIELE